VVLTLKQSNQFLYTL